MKSDGPQRPRMWTLPEKTELLGLSSAITLTASCCQNAGFPLHEHAIDRNESFLWISLANMAEAWQPHADSPFKARRR